MKLSQAQITELKRLAKVYDDKSKSSTGPTISYAARREACFLLLQLHEFELEEELKRVPTEEDPLERI